MDIKNIEGPVSAELKRFNDEYAASLRSETRLLQSAIDTLLQSTGKHVRPLLLLLSAKACGQISDQTINAAVLVELLHTATLIHDDVVDETKQRRGLPSLNAIYDNRVSVLVGDYFLASALIRSIQTGNLRIVGIISQLGKDLSEGEIKQLETAEESILDESCYLQVIRKKTAMLLSGCAEIGALSARADESLVTTCRNFGEYLGYAFQIKDDIFDYFKENQIGKPTGNDIREGKVTLPLLYALRQGGTQAERMTRIIREKDFTQAHVEELIAFAKTSGGIEYATQRMQEYYRLALEQIQQLPLSAARDALLQLATFVVERKK